MIELVLPPSVIFTAIALFLLPVIRWIEERTEVWILKTYTSLVWSLVIWSVTIYELFLVHDSGVPKTYYPVLPVSYMTIEFVASEHSLALAGFVGFMFIIIMFYSVRYLKWETLLDDAGMYKLYYYFLLYACYLGVLVIIFSNDAFTLFVGWELMVLPGYALVALRPRRKASEAGIKYALQSSIGSIFFLYGIATLYEVTGQLNLTRARNYLIAHPELQKNTGPWQIIVFIIIGIGVTAGYVGMQTWVPDAYGEAPSSVSAFISGAFALAALIVFEKLIITVFDPNVYLYADLFLWGGIGTMTVGNLGALQQRDIRRFLGYSSIAQRGYLLFGIGILAKSSNYVAVMKAVYSQALAYMLLEGVLFLAIGNILYIHWYKLQTRDINILQGSARYHVITAATIVIASLGLAGIPPSMGFVSKLSLFFAAGITGIHPGFVVAFALNSIISIVYYARFIRRLVFTEPSDHIKNEQEVIPSTMNLATILVIAVTLVMTVKPIVWINIL